MKKIGVIIISLLTFLPLWSQALPRVAVIPFEAKSVSAVDAEVISQIFETALVNTNAFSVIEQNKINEILEAG